jgi:hypothetical protein
LVGTHCFDFLPNLSRPSRGSNEQRLQATPRRLFRWIADLRLFFIVIPGLAAFARCPWNEDYHLNQVSESCKRRPSLAALRRTNHFQQYRITGSLIAHRYDRRTLADAY